MKKYFSFLILCSVAGVSIYFLNHYERSKQALVSVAIQNQQSREPAQVAETPNICFYDRLEPKNIKNEIARAEKESRFLPKEVLGKPKEIFNYFKSRSSGFINFDIANANRCEDIPCVYKEIYGKESSAKDLAYLFFLNTGVILSGHNAPTGVWSSPDVKNWLFEEDELYFLAVISMDISTDAHDILPAGPLRGIIRVEHGKVFAMAWTACGFASSMGYIQLMDGCLRTAGDRSQETDTFGYIATLHEMGHHLDFGKGNYGQYTYSSSKEWLAFSGWKRNSEFDKKRAVAKDGWTYDKDADGFTRDYGATNPAEDFAESVGYFMFEPSTLKSHAKNKYAFISHLINKDQGRLPEETLATYVDESKKALLPAVDGIIQSCYKNSQGAPTHHILQDLKDVAPGTISCVENMAIQFVNKAANKRRYQDIKGCSLLGVVGDTKYAEGIVDSLKEEISTQIYNFFNIEKVKKIRIQILQTFDPHQNYLLVSLNADPAKEYNALLEAAFNQNVSLYSNIEKLDLKLEKEIFLSTYNYEKAKEETEKFIDDFIQKNIKGLQQAADATLQKCLQAAPSDQKIYEPFSSDAGLLKTSFLSCLNKDFPTLVDQIIQSNLKKLADALHYNLENHDKPLQEKLQQRAKVISFNYLNDTLKSYIEKDADLFSKLYAAYKAQLYAEANAQKFSDLPINKELSTCLNFVHNQLQKYFTQHKGSTKDKIQVLDYTVDMSHNETLVCKDVVESNPEYIQKKLSARTELAKNIFQLANKQNPTDFPLTGGFKDYAVVQQKVEDCRNNVGKLVYSQQSLIDGYPEEVIGNSLEEVCLNGRFAGKFTFTQSDHYLFFGGVRVLGTAKLTPEAEKAMTPEDRPYSLFAQRRYLELRTFEINSSQNK